MKRLSPAIYLALALIPFAGSCNKPVAPSSATPSTASPAVAASASGSTTSSSPASQSDRDAITAAIQKHLGENKGINMAAMEMSVGTIAVNGDQAQADTEFHLKQGGTSMAMTYFLERHGGGWLVVRSQQSDAGQFAHPPMDQVHSGNGTAAPTGSASAPGATPALPDVSDYLKNHAPPKSN